MIKIVDKNDCCGCNACSDICPTNAITFEVDNEGFWYPKVNLNKCIDCGMCERICPMLNMEKARSFGQREPRVYGGYHKNVAIRFDSTSGGVFSALANMMYRQGGYVSGAVFNEDWSVSNYISNDKRDLSRLRSSKYVESYAEGLYKEIRRLLNAGEKVLACGSPCQMAALRTFLRKDYENLIIVDFLCRATNSPKAYKCYLKYLENTYGSKIVSIKAKNKDHGWRSLARKVVFENGTVYYGEGHEDDYRRGYHRNCYERPSCYTCKFKGLPRLADITLGDFWGIEKVAPSLDGNLGTSMVMINTDKGQKFFDEVLSKMNMKEFSLSDVLIGNRGPIMGDCCVAPKDLDRAAMFHDMDLLPFNEVANKYFPLKQIVYKSSIIQRLKSTIRRIINVGKHPQSFARKIFWNRNKRVNGDIIVNSNCAIDLRPGSKIVINNGCLNLGIKRNHKSKLETRLLLENNAQFIIEGNRNILYGSDIQVFKGAVLSMGSGNCNSGLQIVCAEQITIGHNTYIGRDVWIRDNNGGHTIVQPGYTNSAPVKIGNYCWIGSNVVIMKGVTIGDGAIVAANSVVNSNVPAHTLVSGNPATVISENIIWVH